MAVIAVDRPPNTTGAAAAPSRLTRSRLRELALLPPRPGLLSLAGGLPAPELVPRTAYAEALREVLAGDASALQYGQPHEPLRVAIVELMRQRGVDCHPRQILLTSGAQQALSLAAQLLMVPGGQVLLEDHVYAGLRQALLPYRPSLLTVRTDLDAGMDVDAAEALLARGARPAFIYAIADTHNPCGVRLGRERRARLVALARRFGVPILEDDSYGLLHYDPDPLPALRALDAEWVLYVGTFSKIIAPALRLGWLVLPPRLASAAGVLKEAADLECSALTQRAVARLLGGDSRGISIVSARGTGAGGTRCSPPSASTSPRAHAGRVLPGASSCGWSCRRASTATGCARRRWPRPTWPWCRGPPSPRAPERPQTACG